MDNLIVTTEKVKELLELAERHDLKELRFELVISKLFPEAYKNMKHNLRLEHTRGYFEGLQAAGVSTIHTTDSGIEYLKEDIEQVMEKLGY